MSQKISYADMLMKNQEVQFEVTKKTQVHEYARKDIKKLCTTGNLEQLKKVPLKYFTEDTKLYLFKSMKDKIVEIEMWKCEDQNQLSGKLEELDLRIISINECNSYLESVI